MAKSPAAIFTCTACGATHRKWAGRCEACGAWNSISEEAPLTTGPSGKGLGAARGRTIPLTTLSTEEPPPPRTGSGMDELDRVLGGGLVAASAILVGGDPGIGKSTLLLQAAASFAHAGLKCLYISGEEASAQVRMRAQRLGLAQAPVALGAETNLRDILTTLDAERPDLAIIDSIQTMWSDTVEAAPGSVTQVRAAAQELVNFAKKRGTAVILVGHVTKEGQIAGPRVVEHMVDTVLYFEGERGHQFRILRAVKNRFGPTDEIGVFEMSDGGLREVTNPSRLFMGSSERASPGTAVFAGMEGTRPLLVEVQALVSPSPLGTPRRTAVGWDSNRLAMILAVLDARAGVSLGQHDVYLNVAGGLRLKEPAADLAVAAALLSSLSDTIIPHGTVLFGEIALSGSIRPVGQSEARLKEAQKLGLTDAIIAEQAEALSVKGLSTRGLSTVADLVAWVASRSKGLRRIA